MSGKFLMRVVCWLAIFGAFTGGLFHEKIHRHDLYLLLYCQFVERYEPFHCKIILRLKIMAMIKEVGRKLVYLLLDCYLIKSL